MSGKAGQKSTLPTQIASTYPWTGRCRLDGRTRVAKLLCQRRKELEAHVGGAPSCAESMLVERVVHLDGLASQFETQLLAGKPIEIHLYLQTVQTLSAALKYLGIRPRARTVSSFAEALAQAPEVVHE